MYTCSLSAQPQVQPQITEDMHTCSQVDQPQAQPLEDKIITSPTETSINFWSNWRNLDNEDNLREKDNLVNNESLLEEKQQTPIKYDITRLIQKPKITTTNKTTRKPIEQNKNKKPSPICEKTTTNNSGQNKQHPRIVVLKPPSTTSNPIEKTTRKKTKELLTDQKTPKISRYFTAVSKPTNEGKSTHQNITSKNTADTDVVESESESEPNSDYQTPASKITRPGHVISECSKLQNISILHRRPDLEKPN